MAYGSAKGRIFRGDIYAEDDPNQDTYIDWGNDFISFGVGGVKVLNVSASNTLVQVLGNVSASLNMTASGHVSASAFYGDGQYLKNVTSTPAGANQQIQFNDATAFGADSSLQWAATPKLLIVTGTVSASSTLISKYVTASTHVSATTFYGDGQYLKNVGGGGSGDGIFTTLGSGNAYTTSSIRVGSVGEPSASLHVSGTGTGAGPVFRLDSSVAGGRPLFFVTGSGRVGIGTDSPSRTLEIEEESTAAFQLTALNARGAGHNNSYSFISDYIGFSIFETSLGGTPAYRFCIADGGGQTTRGFVGIGNGAGMAGSTFPTAQLHVSASNGGPAFRVDGDAAAVALFVTASSNVGICTVSPKTSLDVHYTGSGNPTSLGDDTGGGEVVYFGTSSASGLQAGALYYLNESGGWASSSAATASVGPTQGGANQLLALSLGTNPSADGMLVRGYFDATTYYEGTFKRGGPVYMATSSAKAQSSTPTGSGNFVRVLGYATDTPNVIYFNPDSTYIELT